MLRERKRQRDREGARHGNLRGREAETREGSGSGWLDF